MKLSVNGQTVDLSARKAQNKILFAELRHKASPLYPHLSTRAARRRQRQRRVSEALRKTNYGASVTIESLPIDMQIDVREVGRAARDLGLAYPIRITTIPLEEQEKNPNRMAYWQFADGRHNIYLEPALDARTAGDTIMHELAHGHQFERELGEGRKWNDVAAAAKELAGGDKHDSWIEREARAFAREFADDYRFTSETR